MESVWSHTTWLFTNYYFYQFVFIVAILVVIYVYQDVALYQNYLPHVRKYEYLPSRYDLPFEDVWLNAADGVRIHGWFIRYKDPKRDLLEAYKTTPTVVFFNGHASNISYLLNMVRDMHNTVKCNVFLISYRGYGRSEGRPSEKGLMLDAEAALGFVVSRNDVNDDKIFLFGDSLGGAVALFLAKQRSRLIKGVIIQDTFTSVPDMMTVLMPHLRHFKWFCKNQWRNTDIVQTLPPELSILFLGAERDEWIPPRMMVKLYEDCNSTKKHVMWFPHATHYTIWQQPGYFERINKFIYEENADVIRHDSPSRERRNTRRSSPSEGGEIINRRTRSMSARSEFVNPTTSNSLEDANNTFSGIEYIPLRNGLDAEKWMPSSPSAVL
ncbi:hypothetical protein AKO1_005839 [Acrasis kona]|uniref:Serine aminopeptidase S33 domain-containing protein n=1 Tax=Acrasis kona TaxID=1008807 RepID=A0AAW2YJQ1_9EUKA